MFRINEARTRYDLTDPALARAGWDVHDPHQVGIEIPVDGSDAEAWAQFKAILNKSRTADNPLDGEIPSGIADYVLYRENMEVLAIVEAKKTSIDPRLAEAQAEYYVTEIAKRQSFRPFAFMTNGLDIYFLDAGVTSKRLVAGVFSRADLERLLWIREHKAPFASAPVNTTITDRGYQIEAIRRVCEAFEQNKRRKPVDAYIGTREPLHDIWDSNIAAPRISMTGLNKDACPTGVSASDNRSSCRTWPQDTRIVPCSRAIGYPGGRP